MTYVLLYLLVLTVIFGTALVLDLRHRLTRSHQHYTMAMNGWREACEVLQAAYQKNQTYEAAFQQLSDRLQALGDDDVRVSTRVH